MHAEEIVRTFISALQAGDMELAASTMADEFLLEGLTPQPLDKNEFLATQSELLAAMPDFSYNLSEIHRDGKTVTAFIQITGSQSNDLSLPVLGLRLIEATGIYVVLPQVQTEFQVEDGKVVVMRSESVPGGGFSGLVQQIGAELPLLPRKGDISM